MDTRILLKGLIIGLSIAAPVGPIGVLCIRRTLADGRVFGFVSGLGAATADAIYGCVAGFGLTFVSNALTGHQSWLRLGGGIFLCLLGVKTIAAKTGEEAAPARGRGLAGDYASTFILTLTNPMTILSFIGVFAALGVGAAGSGYGDAALLVAGVFAGSALWWLMLSGVTGLLRTRLNSSAMRWVNRMSGIIIAGFGVAALLSRWL